MKQSLLLILTLCTAFGVRSQNLIVNSNMSGWSGDWTGGACTAETGFTEDNYGGPSTTNKVAEVDFLACMQQTIGISTGTAYTITFKALRRTNCFPTLPLNPGINVKVTGVTTSTVYSNVNYHYNNPDDPAPPAGWPGYTTQNQTFFVSGADAQVRLEITPIDNTDGCGIVMDDITMVASGSLPVNLVSFNAAAKNSTVDLTWTTNNETNNDYFVVYRSKNGAGFDEIGRVTATGFASGVTYNLNDAQPANGVNYYRLRQVDKNGASKYSGIIKASLASKNLDIFVYPTIIAGDVLNYVVENPKAEKLSVMVSDISGKRISNSIVNFTAGTTQKSINVSSLASGVYLLTVSDANNTFKKSVTFKKN